MKAGDADNGTQIHAHLYLEPVDFSWSYEARAESG